MQARGTWPGDISAGFPTELRSCPGSPEESLAYVSPEFLRRTQSFSQAETLHQDRVWSSCSFSRWLGSERPSTGPRSHSKFKANSGFEPRPPASKAGCRFTVGTKKGVESMVPSPKVSSCLTSTGHRLSVGFPERFSTKQFLLCFECFPPPPPLTPSMLAGLHCPVLCSPI